MIQLRHSLILSLFLLSGCAGQRSLNEGLALIDGGEIDAGLAKISKPTSLTPGIVNIDFSTFANGIWRFSDTYRWQKPPAFRDSGTVQKQCIDESWNWIQTVPEGKVAYWRSEQTGVNAPLSVKRKIN
ncbi:MAG: hypothetical protein IPK29_15285 [Betaproteobacteria bacterium]|nr:hypothetical protein [Betaproteobacteria bacterium]